MWRIRWGSVCWTWNRPFRIWSARGYRAGGGSAVLKIVSHRMEIELIKLPKSLNADELEELSKQLYWIDESILKIEGAEGGTALRVGFRIRSSRELIERLGNQIGKVLSAFDALPEKRIFESRSDNKQVSRVLRCVERFRCGILLWRGPSRVFRRCC